MPKAGYSSVTIPQPVYAQLAQEAKQRKTTVSTFLVQLVNGTVPSTVLQARFATEGAKRAGWDSNPRFAAPQAAVLVLARLPALEETLLILLITGTTENPT